MASAAAAGIQCVYRAITACCTKYSTVQYRVYCTYLAVTQPDSLGRVLPAGGNTRQNTRAGGEGREMGGGGHAKKPGECD